MLGQDKRDNSIQRISYQTEDLEAEHILFIAIKNMRFHTRRWKKIIIFSADRFMFVAF